VNPPDGWYTLLPETPAVPIVVPPEAQLVGALDCGPNTVNVTVPDGEEPPDSTAEIDDAAIFVPAFPGPGATTNSDADPAVPTTVSAID
jgi:hypothetical protein